MLPQGENVRLAVYDLQGRLVKQLLNRKQIAGRYSIRWNTTQDAVSSGVYIYQIRAGAFRQARKMMIIK